MKISEGRFCKLMELSVCIVISVSYISDGGNNVEKYAKLDKINLSCFCIRMLSGVRHNDPWHGETLPQRCGSVAPLQCDKIIDSGPKVFLKLLMLFLNLLSIHNTGFSHMNILIG